MVGIAKRLMDKAGKEKKPWISGLLEYRIIPQLGNIASPMELMMQWKERATKLPHLPQSNIGNHNMYNVCKELLRRQGNCPEREY